MCSCLVKVSLVDINISRGRLRRQFPFHKSRKCSGSCHLSIKNKQHKPWVQPITASSAQQETDDADLSRNKLFCLFLLILHRILFPLKKWTSVY